MIKPSCVWRILHLKRQFSVIQQSRKFCYLTNYQGKISFRATRTSKSLNQTQNLYAKSRFVSLASKGQCHFQSFSKEIN